MGRVETEVSGLHYYPIKSCAITNVETSIEIGERGISYDRHWMVVRSDGMFITQREYPKMARINPVVEDNRLIVSAVDELSVLELPLDSRGDRLAVEVWGNMLEAVDEGDIASQWFSDYLGARVRLVHMPSDFVREKTGARFQFADSYPLLIVSEESLADLNQRIQASGGNPVSMSRFRPNIVVRGVRPYEEDTWREIRLGEVGVEVVKPCIRCPIPQVDQTSGIKGKEPTKTLLTYRRISRTEVIFAQKASPLNQGKVGIGDRVEVVTTKDAPQTL